MIRYEIIFKGIVQGVGFRYQVKRLANKYQLTGDVKNLYNGDVKMQIQGNQSNITYFIEKLDYLRFVQIDKKSINKINPKPDEKEFKIVY